MSRYPFVPSNRCINHAGQPAARDDIRRNTGVSLYFDRIAAMFGAWLEGAAQSLDDDAIGILLGSFHSFN